MEEKKKRIFLLLPEISKETSKEISIPTTKDCYNENANVMMLNVYEHYRTFYSRRKATCLALQLIEGFDEIWYYAGYGITDPIKCCLKKGEELNIPIKLTTYVARHSYATVLKRAGVATSIICESLGHSSEKVTQIYLDNFENNQIDKAMELLK